MFREINLINDMRKDVGKELRASVIDWKLFDFASNVENGNGMKEVKKILGE